MIHTACARRAHLAKSGPSSGRVRTTRAIDRCGTGAADLLPEELADEVLEVVDAVLALGGEAAGVVGAGAQAALDLLADDDVLLLDLVGEGDRLLHRLPTGTGAGVGEEPLEDGEGL